MDTQNRAQNTEDQVTFSVDSFQDGIAFGQHRLEPGNDARDFYALRLNQLGDLVALRSRYAFHKENPLAELERHLARLARQGVLHTSQVYLGTTTDPFFPFEGKFDVSMKFLDLFRRYTPGMLIVQTRSPLIVIALPVFKALGPRAAVTIGIETNDDQAVARYTPGFPRVEERLKAATALRRFGVEVTLQVAPVLPYGDWRADAGRFAELLAANGDYVFVRPMSDGSEKVERRIRATHLARSLARDRKFHWLRPDTATPLISALERIAPKKLLVPERPTLEKRQLEMFVA